MRCVSTLIGIFGLLAAATVAAPTEKWQKFVPYGDQVKGGITIAPDAGLACSILQDPSDNAVLFCLDPSSGDKAFSSNLGMFPIHTPKITITENLVVVAAPTKIYGFDRTSGSQVWTNQNEATIAVLDTSVGGGDAAFVGYGPDTLYGIASNGTTLWSQTGQFGECSFFPKPMYNNNGTVFLCARTMVGGFPAVFAFDAKTGNMDWFDFEHGTDPNALWVDGTSLFYMKMNSSQYIHAYLVDAKSGMIKWKFATEHQHATGNVVNGSVAVVGTWGYTAALSLVDGSVMWSIPDPVDLTGELSVPIPCGDNGLALFHLQIDENKVQSLRRVDLMTGNVLWNSTMTVNGAQPWYFSQTGNLLTTRTPQHLYAYDFATGDQLWVMQISENDFSAFADNFMLVTQVLQVFQRYSLSN